MKLKPITVIAVLSLVVASLFVAGCTTSTTSNTNQSPTPSTATHDAFLEKFLAAFKDSWYANENYTTPAWEVTWINSTSARLNFTFKDDTTATNQTGNMVFIFTTFPTTQDATNYVNALNKTANYNIVYTDCGNTSGSSGAPGAFMNATGHAPQICKYYQRSEGTSSSSLDYRLYLLYQYDNLVIEGTGKNVG
jgi:hypothetical protein